MSGQRFDPENFGSPTEAELAVIHRMIDEDRAAIARGVPSAKLGELTALLASRDVPLVDRICIEAGLKMGAMTEELADDWIAEFRTLDERTTP